MVDLVDLEEEGLHDVVADELEAGVAEVVHHILLLTSEVVRHDHAVVARD